MNAMELRELAQEALAKANSAYSPGARLLLLKFADKLTMLAREQFDTAQDDGVRRRPTRH